MTLKYRLSNAARVLFEETAATRAFKRLDTKREIHFQCFPEQVEDFDLDEAVVYLGALPSDDFLGGIVEVLDFLDKSGDKGGTYSKTAVLAVLEQVAQRRKDGQKVKIVLAAGLGEICNPNTEKIADLKKQYLQVAKLYEQYFGLPADDLEFVEIAKDHPELFKALADPRPMDEIFSVASTDDWSSFGIACRLYQVAKSDSQFQKALKKLMPRSLSASFDPTEFSLPFAYGLFEVAIHLADVIRGRPVQIGVGRQVKYNEVVVDLMRGRGGPWRDSIELHQLFRKLEGLKFCGVSVEKSPNPLSSKILRGRARVRLALQSLSLVGLLGIGIGIGEKKAAEEEARLEAVRNEAVAAIADALVCPNERAELGVLSRDQKSARLHGQLLALRVSLEDGFGMVVSDGSWEGEMVPRFLDFALFEVEEGDQTGFCEFLAGDPAYTTNIAARFVTSRRTTLSAMGFEVRSSTSSDPTSLQTVP